MVSPKRSQVLNAALKVDFELYDEESSSIRGLMIQSICHTHNLEWKEEKVQRVTPAQR